MQTISFVSIRITSVSFIDLLELCSNSTVTLVLVRMPLLYNPQNHVDFLSVMLHLMKEIFDPKEMKKKLFKELPEKKDDQPVQAFGNLI